MVTSAMNVRSVVMFLQSWRRATSPTEEWGPALTRYRRGIYGTTFIPAPEYTDYKKDKVIPDTSINPALQEEEF